MQRRLRLADHQAEQIDDGREQQRTLMLSLSRLTKNSIQLRGRQNVRHQPADHRSDGSLLGKLRDECIERHGLASVISVRHPPVVHLRTILTTIDPTQKPLLSSSMKA